MTTTPIGLKRVPLTIMHVSKLLNATLYLTINDTHLMFKVTLITIKVILH